MHLRNPLNEDKPIKISRDGQEVDPTVGLALCTAIDEGYVAYPANSMKRLRLEDFEEPAAKRPVGGGGGGGKGGGKGGGGKGGGGKGGGGKGGGGKGGGGKGGGKGGGRGIAKKPRPGKDARKKGGR